MFIRERLKCYRLLAEYGISRGISNNIPKKLSDEALNAAPLKFDNSLVISPTLYNGSNYLYMLGLKLIRIVNGASYVPAISCHHSWTRWHLSMEYNYGSVMSIAWYSLSILKYLMRSQSPVLSPRKWRTSCDHHGRFAFLFPDSKVHGSHMGPIWGRQDPGGPIWAPWTLLPGFVCFLATLRKRESGFSSHFKEKQP